MKLLMLLNFCQEIHHHDLFTGLFKNTIHFKGKIDFYNIAIDDIDALEINRQTSNCNTLNLYNKNKAPRCNWPKENNKIN